MPGGLFGVLSPGSNLGESGGAEVSAFKLGAERKPVYLLLLSPLRCSPSVCLSDLQASQSFEHYSISDEAMDYRILHMDEDQDRMYVGCKDHVLSMDINNVTDGTLKVGRTPQSFIPQIAVITYHDAILAIAAASQQIRALVPAPPTAVPGCLSDVHPKPNFSYLFALFCVYLLADLGSC